MVKMIVLYTHPTDKEAFEKHYHEVHVPLVNALPNLKRAEIAHVTGAPRGESPYYLIAELYWENAETMNADMASEQMRAVGKDVRNLPVEPPAMFLAEVKE